jgi:hypothetical protein
MNLGLASRVFNCRTTERFYLPGDSRVAERIGVRRPAQRANENEIRFHIALDSPVKDRVGSPGSVVMHLKAGRFFFATITRISTNPFPLGLFFQTELSYQFGFTWQISLPRKLQRTPTTFPRCAPNHFAAQPHHMSKRY